MACLLEDVQLLREEMLHCRRGIGYLELLVHLGIPVLKALVPMTCHVAQATREGTALEVDVLGHQLPGPLYILFSACCMCLLLLTFLATFSNRLFLCLASARRLGTLCPRSVGVAGGSGALCAHGRAPFSVGGWRGRSVGDRP